MEASTKLDKEQLITKETVLHAKKDGAKIYAQIGGLVIELTYAKVLSALRENLYNSGMGDIRSCTATGKLITISLKAN